MKHTCPVCGYAMPYPPQDYNICSCCATEFDGTEDSSVISELRLGWLKGGAKWWSTLNSPPSNWDPWQQLNELIAEMEFSQYDLRPPVFRGLFASSPEPSALRAALASKANAANAALAKPRAPFTSAQEQRYLTA